MYLLPFYSIMDRIKIRTGENEDVFKEVCRLLFQSTFLLRATIFKHLKPKRSLMVLWDRWSGALPPHNYQRSFAHLSYFNQRPEPFEGLWRNLMQDRDPKCFENVSQTHTICQPEKKREAVRYSTVMMFIITELSSFFLKQNWWRMETMWEW